VQLDEAYAFEPEVRGVESRWDHWHFSLA